MGRDIRARIVGLEINQRLDVRFGRRRRGPLGLSRPVSDAAGHHDGEPTHGGEPQEDREPERALVESDAAEVAQLAAAGIAEQCQGQRRHQRRNPQLGHRVGQR